MPSGAPAGAPITNRPEQKVELDTPDVRFVFSSRGASLQHAEPPRPLRKLEKSIELARTLQTFNSSG